MDFIRRALSNRPGRHQNKDKSRINPPGRPE
jgi:hypothetical protein